MHAVCEVLQMFRSRTFRAAMLRRFEFPLALIEVTLPASATGSIVDLDAPAELVRLQLTPGELASESRSRTQTVARRVYASGAAGMRWWSKLNGDWHGVVLFLDRVPVATLEIGAPELLTPEHPAVVRACEFLAITGGRHG